MVALHPNFDTMGGMQRFVMCRLSRNKTQGISEIWFLRFLSPLLALTAGVSPGPRLTPLKVLDSARSLSPHLRTSFKLRRQHTARAVSVQPGLLR